MNNIQQPAISVAQLSQAINPSQTPNPSQTLRKLLLIDGLSEQGSSTLIEKLQSLELSALETSKGLDSLLLKVTSMCPDVLIISVDTMTQAILSSLTEIHQASPLPVIVIAQQYGHEEADGVVSAGVSAYLVDEISTQRLMVIIEISIARFKQEQLLITELQQTKDKLSERKLVERAKGIIMKQKDLSEEQAYSQMRKTAMNQGQSMAVLAKKIISVFEMLE